MLSSIPSTAKYVHMYLYKRDMTYLAIPTSTSIFICIYIKIKPYARICCILDYLNACVLQKCAWPNSINSRKYTKLRYYWIVVNFTIITELEECIYRVVQDIFRAAYHKLKSKIRHWPSHCRSGGFSTPRCFLLAATSSSSRRPRGWIPPPPSHCRRRRWIPPLVVVIVVAAAAAGSLLLQISLSEVWCASRRAWCGACLCEGM
jgi:hypothetical protein